MKKPIVRISRLATAIMASALLNGFIATAADAPANPAPPNPAPDTPPAANNGGPGGRQGRRGNFNAGGGGNFQGGRGNNFGGGPGGGGFNLDDNQRELLREATQNEIDALRKLNEQLQAAQKELVQAVVAEKYDEKVVREKAEAVSKIQTEITMSHAKAFSSVSPTLKPDQREQLDQNPRLGVGFITGGGFGFGGGGNFAGGNFGGRGGRGNFGGNGGPPNQIRQRGGPPPGQ